MRSLVFALVSATFVGSLALVHCGGVAQVPVASDGGGSNDDGGPASDGSANVDGSHPVSTDGSKPLDPPMNHIPSAPTCRMSRPAGQVNDAPDAGNASCGPGQFCCNDDSDCTAGTNGRCGYLHNGPPTCTYDQCFSDGDCTAGSTCLCADPMAPSQNNKCLPSNCRTDSDCGSFDCSPTYDTSCGSYNGYVGIYCHTANDECSNDSDCTGGAMMGPGYCAFDKSVAKWVCEYGICAG